MTEAEPLPAPIDFDLLRVRTSHDCAFALDLLRLFSNDVQTRLDRMTAALETRDAHRIETDAHTLHGAAASLGAAPLSRLASRLETAAGTIHPEEVSTLLADIRNEFHRLLSYLDRHGWRLSNPPSAGTPSEPVGPDKDPR